MIDFVITKKILKLSLCHRKKVPKYFIYLIAYNYSNYFNCARALSTLTLNRLCLINSVFSCM